jgi:hypothetical protein
VDYDLRNKQQQSAVALKKGSKLMLDRINANEESETIFLTVTKKEDRQNGFEIEATTPAKHFNRIGSIPTDEISKYKWTIRRPVQHMIDYAVKTVFESSKLLNLCHDEENETNATRILKTILHIYNSQIDQPTVESQVQIDENDYRSMTPHQNVRLNIF